MTREERESLCDSIGIVEDAAEKARVIVNELTDGYFTRYDADRIEDHIPILDQHRRMRAFALILCDLIYEMSDLLPDSRWVKRITTTNKPLRLNKGA